MHPDTHARTSLFLSLDLDVLVLRFFFERSNIAATSSGAGGAATPSAAGALGTSTSDMLGC